MIYGIIYTILAILSLNNNKIKNYNRLNLLVFISLIIIYGFRHETGGDWFSNENYYNSVTNFQSFIQYNYNIAFNFLIFISRFLNIDYSGFIFIQTLIFFYSIYRFSSFFENKYFILCLMFPISIMILGSGFIRQGLAFSCFLFFLTTNKKYNFLFLILAIFFHFTSIIYLSLYLLKFIRTALVERIFINIYAFLIILIFLFFFTYDHIGFYFNHYFSGYYQSSGALLRILINFISAVLIIILYFKKYFILDKDYKEYFLYSSIVVIILSPLVVLYSTPIDRIQLYFSFLPAVALYILLDNIKQSKIKIKMHLNILFVFFFIFWVWYNYGSFSYNWNYNFLFF